MTNLPALPHTIAPQRTTAVGIEYLPAGETGDETVGVTVDDLHALPDPTTTMWLWCVYTWGCGMKSSVLVEQCQVQSRMRVSLALADTHMHMFTHTHTHTHTHKQT